MQAKARLNRNTAVLAIAIAAIVVSVVTMGIVLTARNAELKKVATEGRYPSYQPPFTPLGQRYGGTSRPMVAFSMHRNLTPLRWKQTFSENMRKPSNAKLTVTSDQAKTKVSDAIKEFTVGDARDGGNTWMVSVKYRDGVVMSVLLGKLNTPTAEAAVKAVQESMAKGWKVGEPKQLQTIYNVPILDTNGSTIGTIKIDGRTGNITTRISTPHR